MITLSGFSLRNSILIMGFTHFFLYSDYEVQCICHEGSGCNLHDDPNLGDSIITAPNDAILAEVNKSIRQLRADLKRVIRRYAKNAQQTTGE